MTEKKTSSIGTQQPEVGQQNPQDKSISPPAFSPEELSVCYRALMELPLKRSDPQFAVADGVISKIRGFAAALNAAKTNGKP